MSPIIFLHFQLLILPETSYINCNPNNPNLAPTWTFFIIYPYTKKNIILGQNLGYSGFNIYYLPLLLEYEFVTTTTANKINRPISK